MVWNTPLVLYSGKGISTCLALLWQRVNGILAIAGINCHDENRYSDPCPVVHFCSGTQVITEVQIAA